MDTPQHQPELNRFILSHENALAVLQYRLFNDAQGRAAIDFNSTYVPQEFLGKGLAEKLVRTGIKWAKEQGYQLQASCWYAAKFIK